MPRLIRSSETLLNKFTLVAFFGAALFGTLIAAALSDDLPAIPSPKGFIEASSLVPVLKDQALLGHPARTQLIGVYLLPDELDPACMAAATR
jgi:hypothetical protein